MNNRKILGFTILVVVALGAALLPGKLYWYIGIPICGALGFCFAMWDRKPKPPRALPDYYEKLLKQAEEWEAKRWPTRKE